MGVCSSVSRNLFVLYQRFNVPSRPQDITRITMTRVCDGRMCYLVESGKSQLVRLHQTIAPASCDILDTDDDVSVRATWISAISDMRVNRWLAILGHAYKLGRRVGGP